MLLPLLVYFIDGNFVKEGNFSIRKWKKLKLRRGKHFNITGIDNTNKSTYIITKKSRIQHGRKKNKSGRHIEGGSENVRRCLTRHILLVVKVVHECIHWDLGATKHHTHWAQLLVELKNKNTFLKHKICKAVSTTLEYQCVIARSLKGVTAKLLSGNRYTFLERRKIYL